MNNNNNINMNYDLEFLKTNLKIKYLNNIINGCKKININYNNIKNNLEIFNNQDSINYITEMQTEKQIEQETEKQSEKKSELDINTNQIDYLYLKPWTKLTLIHKIIKVKEFVNNLEIKDEPEKDNLKDRLIELIKDINTGNDNMETTPESEIHKKKSRSINVKC